MQSRKNFTNELVHIVKELVQKEKILAERTQHTWEQLQTRRLKVSGITPTVQERGCSVMCDFISFRTVALCYL